MLGLVDELITLHEHEVPVSSRGTLYTLQLATEAPDLIVSYESLLTDLPLDLG